MVRAELKLMHLIFNYYSTMNGLDELGLAFVFALSLVTTEVTGTCQTYCDNKVTGTGTYPCSQKVTRQGTSYRSCGFLWLSRCSSGTYVIKNIVNRKRHSSSVITSSCLQCLNYFIYVKCIYLTRFQLATVTTKTLKGTKM